MADDWHSERSLEISADLDPIRRSTCGDRPRPSLPRNVPTRIRNLIGELGLRYRPTSQADLEAHAASLALLAVDLADVPPDYLAKAINHHVTRSPYLPKAAELVALAKEFDRAAKPSVAGSLADFCEDSNRRSIERGSALRWYIENGKMKYCSAEELEQRNRPEPPLTARGLAEFRDMAQAVQDAGLRAVMLRAVARFEDEMRGAA